ncbi:MAG: hypothetical protein KDA91_25825, partial [Planctomycetaceae bacterium]|nr:hypothetical protein [Planctomycetaceae bacterium]
MENSDDAREPPRENEIVESVWTTGAATSRPGPQCYDNSAPKSVVSSKTERVVLGERHLEPGHFSAKMPPQSETVARRFVDRRDASDLTIGLRLVSIDKARLTAADFPRLIQQESN